MNTKEIEELLEKYYEGETSLAEENSLKEFFSGDDIPGHLLVHKPLFRFLKEEATKSMNEESQEASLTRHIEKYRAETSIVKTHPGRKRLFYLSGMAATLLILFSLVFVIRNEVGRRNHNRDVNSSTELAYAQTKQALLFVSVGLNTGLDAVRHFKTLDNAMGQIQKINKFYDYQTQFINPEWIKDPSINK
ncbi:MAG: hypothetical protein NTU51_08480 [Bacteroidetes bacterium]|nr:hypothetical protein [Bacteroidota bacterium]